LIRKLKTLKIRIHYEKRGAIYSAVFSGKSELEILFRLREKGIDTRTFAASKKLDSLNQPGKTSGLETAGFNISE